jgi:hypothetical protein
MPTKNPSNQSFAQANKFQLNFERLPEMTFFCQNVNLPGVSTNPITHPTPFVDLSFAGDKLQYENFNVQFIVDEDYVSWLSLYDWMVGITFPENFQQYQNLETRYNKLPTGSDSGLPAYSDAILTINTNKNNPNVKFQFIDLFPISLSAVNLSYEESPETILTATATFSYSFFKRI